VLKKSASCSDSFWFSATSHCRGRRGRSRTRGHTHA
jgi:hypothetical protein